MDAEDFEVFAAVGPAPTTGITQGIVDVWFHSTAIARPDVGDAFSDPKDLDAQFMAGYAGS